MQASITLAADAHQQYLLRIADTCLILAQRTGEWCGHGPVLEEDIALANLALDLLGQARALLAHAGTLGGTTYDEDQLAFLRDERDYLNATLVELPRGDFAFTVVRNTLLSTFLKLLWERLRDSSDAELAAIAGKALKEARYHQQHSADWLVRLGDGTDESRARVEAALKQAWLYAAELFESDAVDEAEYDLSILERLDDKPEEETHGAARYLLGANEYLRRALRFRAERWAKKKWHPADGLVDPKPEVLALLQAHAPGIEPTSRSFSPTALQHFAACPYRFYLQAILRLAPREEKESLEELDALQKGSIFHETMYELFVALRAEKLLPLDEAHFERARTLLDRTMILYGSNLGDANSHVNTNLPTLLAGGGFRHGQHLAFDTTRNYPLPNLYVSMLQRMGLETDRFATSTGPMRGLDLV